MTRPWSHGLCSCFDDTGVCCMAYWCPCILFGKTRYRLQHNGDMSGNSCCSGSCVLFCCFLGLPCAWWQETSQRGKIREEFGLEGGCCGDCLKAACCTCCALAQEENETKERFAEKMRAGYQQQGGMVYAGHK